MSDSASDQLDHVERTSTGPELWRAAVASDLGRQSAPRRAGRLMPRHVVRYGLSYLFLGMVGLTMLLPLAWMVVTSLRSPHVDVMDLSSVFPASSPRMAAADLVDPHGFARLLVQQSSQTSSLAGQIWQLLEVEQRVVLRRVAEQGEMIRAARASEVLADVLNPVLSLGQLDAFEASAAGSSSGELDRSMDRESLMRRNRALLSSVFPDHVRPTRRVTIQNYRHVMGETNFVRALFNSILVTVAITFGQVATSSLAAFAFARLRFPGRDKIFVGYLATLMIPSAVTMIPVFILLRQFGWIDTYAALILPMMFTAYGTFMLRQFFMGLPTELEEAAVLDGCSLWRVYWHVALPLSRPAIAALGILTFMGSWRSFMWPLIVAHSPERFTLPVMLAEFQGMFETQWSMLMAGSVIMVIPMLIVFMVGQRFFVSGIRLGAVKG